MVSETIAALINGTFVDVRGDIWSDNRGAVQLSWPTRRRTRESPTSWTGARTAPTRSRATRRAGSGNGSQPDFVAARSFHGGGVNVLFADGSVKFIKDSIGLEIWRAISTKDNGEVVSSDQY